LTPIATLCPVQQLLNVAKQHVVSSNHFRATPNCRETPQRTPQRSIAASVAALAPLPRAAY